MFLSKRNNGYYYIVYKNKTGIRTLKSTGTKKKSEAYRYLVDFEIRSKENNHILAILNFFELAIKFMRYSETVKSKLTCRDYNLTIKRFSNFIGKSKISEITREIIQEYILDRIKTSSIYQGRKDLINIKAILSWAVKEKLLETNPSDNIKRIKVPEKLPVFLQEMNFQN